MPTPEHKFEILKGIKPRIAPLSMQTSSARALERFKRNIESQKKPTDKPSNSDPKPAA
jgi:hypothetical protein